MKGYTSLRLALPTDPLKLYDPGDEISRKTSRFINNVKDGERGVFAIVGGYGLGKTHVLKYMMKKAEGQGLKTVFIPSTGKSFLDFYSIIAEELLDLTIEYRSEVGNPVLRMALEIISKESKELEVYVRSWLLGYSIPSSIKHKAGLIGVVKDNTAVGLLAEMLNITSKHTEGVLVLIDEVESLLNLPRPARFNYMEYIREVIDALPSKTGIALSMTPACWDETTQLSPGLARRLSGFMLYLKPLRLEDMRSFLKQYFDKYIESLGDDVLEYVYSLSNGIHGEVLKYTSILIEESLLDKAVEQVSLDLAKEILAEYV